MGKEEKHPEGEKPIKDTAILVQPTIQNERQAFAKAQNKSQKRSESKSDFTVPEKGSKKKGG